MGPIQLPLVAGRALVSNLEFAARLAFVFCTVMYMAFVYKVSVELPRRTKWCNIASNIGHEFGKVSRDETGRRAGHDPRAESSEANR